MKMGQDVGPMGSLGSHLVTSLYSLWEPFASWGIPILTFHDRARTSPDCIQLDEILSRR